VAAAVVLVLGEHPDEEASAAPRADEEADVEAAAAADDDGWGIKVCSFHNRDVGRSFTPPPLF
jgi:hypothetical protein